MSTEQGVNLESARRDQGVRMELSVEPAERRKSARSSHWQGAGSQLGVSRELSGSSESAVRQYAAGSEYRAGSQQGVPPPSPFT